MPDEPADPESAMRSLCAAVDASIEICFRSRSLYVPRRKDVLYELERLDSVVARYARTFWGSGSVDDRWAGALAIADRVLGTRGFFEWDSEAQEV